MDNQQVVADKVATPQQGTSSSLRRFNLETIAKNIAFLSLACYIIGYITVNLYLFDLGFSDFSPVNPRFVSTGVLASLLLVLNIILPIIGIWIIFFDRKELSDKYKTWKNKYVRNISKYSKLIQYRFTEWLYGTLCIVAPFLINLLFLNESNRDDAVFLSLILLAIEIFVVMMGSFLIIPDTNEKVKDKPPIYSFGRTLNALFLLSCFCIFYLFMFTSFIYPIVPEQLGGGKPKQARLMIVADAIEGVRELGINITGDNQLSDHVTILYEGSNTYILELSDSIVQVDKSLISGVLIDKE